MGISTITAAYVSWMLLFHRDKNILVIATKFSTASNLVKKVKAMIKLLPPMFDQIATIAIDNRSSFVLSNGSEIKASATSIDAGRSEALSLLVIDEAAHVENFDELWTALQPTMAAGGRCIALSSPNGVGNWFHKTYIASPGRRKRLSPNTASLGHFIQSEIKNGLKKQQEIFHEEKSLKNMNATLMFPVETVIHPDGLSKIAKICGDPKYQNRFLIENFWIWGGI